MFSHNLIYKGQDVFKEQDNSYAAPVASFSCVEIGGTLLLGPALLVVHMAVRLKPLVEVFKGHLLWKTSDFYVRGTKYLVCKSKTAVDG